jgi:cell division protein FtsI (penicillin-binding protein 3)
MQEHQSTQRLKWLLWLMLAWVMAIVGRLMFLQVVKHDELLRLAQSQQQKTVPIEATRGTIFDRAGQPLAKTLPAESICVNPMKIPDVAVAADILSRVLDLDRQDLFKRITIAKNRKSGFMWVKRKVEAEEAARVRSLRLEWVDFRGETRRFYPHGQLAAHVLGSMGVTDADDVIEHGTGGVEQSFDDDLSGQPGIGRVYNDVRQNAYDMLVTRQPDPGANLTLTIDTNLQFDAERSLEEAVQRTHARTASLVAMNPTTGEILALANYPTYDPNTRLDPHQPASVRSDLAVSAPFEPGSVFKVITLSAALETTSLTPDSIINCGGGTMKLMGRVIHDAPGDRFATLSMADVLAHSSNIGAINIGLKVGKDNMYEYVRRFGFGRKTGIDLPGESAGMLRRKQNWEATSLASVAMGHEVGATSIQLAVAGAVVANGGLLVKPRIVSSEQRPGAAADPLPWDKPQRVIAPETAIKMRQMMEGVVLHGTGRKAILHGYTSGGKTGSAQIYDFKTHTYTHSYNASFVGFAPVSNPQIVIAVTLIGTTGSVNGFGGATAAPVFHDVAMSALRMLDVPKDLPETSVRASATPASDKDEVNDVAIAGLGAPPQLFSEPAANVSVKHSPGSPSNAVRMAPASPLQKSSEPARPPVFSSSAVSSVTPPPVLAAASASANVASSDRRPFLNGRAEDSRVVDNHAVDNHVAGNPVAGNSVRGPRVPDFRGMTLNTVLEESAASGLPVEVLGDGLARNQDPPPGSMLPRGARVRVQFTR